jgi:signal transduction histidine kinase
MLKDRINLGAGRGVSLWPVLAVLVVGVLVPAGCILWFMNAAMTSERLAVRQRLLDVYQGFLGEAQGRVDDYWARRLRELDAAAVLPPAEAFSRIALSGGAEAAIVFDASGRPAYPQPETSPAAPSIPTTPWADAQQLEQQGDKFREAAAAYGAIAQDGKDANLRAQALQAQARCLLRAGLRGEAAEVLLRLVAAPDLHLATDDEGRLIVPAARLLLLQMSGDSKVDESSYIARPSTVTVRTNLSPDVKVEVAAALAADLAKQVNDYTLPFPSGQRLFLMEQLLPYSMPEAFPTLAAERLAGQCVESATAWPAQPGKVVPLPDGRLWLLASTSGRAAALWRGEALLGTLTSLVGMPPHGATVAVEMQGPNSTPAELEKSSEPFLRTAGDKFMPALHLALRLEGSDPFTAAAARQNAMYLWTAGAGILVVTLLALVVAGYLRRQVRLTRLKNDFVATVSHELKTPLASMRLLVDTVLEGRTRDAAQVHDYLRLIARENERLTRLIDNFLTFSRMERNKRSFEFRRVEVADIVEAATSAVADRFNSPDRRIERDIPGGLPAIYGDRDALITVLVNLLDNAWKYSGDKKVVRLRAWPEDGAVWLEVADNGIGMTCRAQKRIFDRFYQVDSSLSRQAGGCGLGLAIVKFILDAHGAAVRVASQPGQGSTFTLRLPLDRPEGVTLP